MNAYIWRETKEIETLNIADSEASRDLGASAEHNKVGPDYFAFYTREVAELLSQDEDFLPFSSKTSDLAGTTHGVGGENDATRRNYNSKENTLLGSLFCNGFGDKLSDFKKERLKAVLQQSVIALSQEVDEKQKYVQDPNYQRTAMFTHSRLYDKMLDPVLAICRIQSYLRREKNLSNHSAAAFEVDSEQHPHKKIKLSSSSNIPMQTSPITSRAMLEDSGNEGKTGDKLEKGIYNGIKKKCSHCHTTETSKWRTGPEGSESLCNACGVKFAPGKEPSSVKDQKKGSCLVSNIGADNESRDVNDDLQFLLENDATMVEESMKKYSDEISTTLGHMEQQLEQLLDTVLYNCRLMTLSEKQQLRRLIERLPSRNLDRVVEIIQRNKPSVNRSADEVHVDLDKQDNVTLWRLYYYVEAVENARKLPR